MLYYVPKPHKKNAPCPSEEWWSSDLNSEEREVAFVACTRARNDFVLAVHKKTATALKEKRREFYGHFEVQTLDESHD